MSSLNSFDSLQVLTVDAKKYRYYDVCRLQETVKMPRVTKIVVENLLRHEDGRIVSKTLISRILQSCRSTNVKSDHDEEIAFYPARVLMQDFTGVPAIVDLAAMRDAVRSTGGDPSRVSPVIPVDLVIDHSVQVDSYGSADALKQNYEHEKLRNYERYAFLKWGQRALNNFRVIPSGNGICHQVNIEYLAQVVMQTPSDDDAVSLLYPDTVVGTDSHTTMVNALGVLGWGVGGIEAEAGMLGQPLSMLMPPVVGVKVLGKLREGVSATDLVLTVTQLLRKQGVVGCFIEFYGPGLGNLTLADRATVSNMCPEYGATCAYFPIDQETLSYLHLTGREPQNIAIVEAYAKAQGLWRNDNEEQLNYDRYVELDLATVEPSMAGPVRPQDRLALAKVPESFEMFRKGLKTAGAQEHESQKLGGHDIKQNLDSVQDGSVVIAAITSCTNTSNPLGMIGAGLIAKKAWEKGLRTKPWVKTSLAPGSKAVTAYLAKSGLSTYLDNLGFYLVGYGCTTCIGNSGPLDAAVASDITAKNLKVVAVLSGNRNFEGRIHPMVAASYLASPMLCVVYALVGHIQRNIEVDPIGYDQNGDAVYLRDIWPSSAEIREVVSAAVDRETFRKQYSHGIEGDEWWNSLAYSEEYHWDAGSTYIQKPPYFEKGMAGSVLHPVKEARIIANLGDSITTDHISPAGTIGRSSPAATYLREHGVLESEFNSYGARRGNHEVMVRGTLANSRIRNRMVPGMDGGYTKYYRKDVEEGEITDIYTAAAKYREDGHAVVIFAGKEYGTGSSRDWAAKGVRLLGVRAVIAESFERIHRSNLVGMGVIPLMLLEPLESLGLQGNELISIPDLHEGIRPKEKLTITVLYKNGRERKVPVICRVDTELEMMQLKSGGVLPYVYNSYVS